MSGKIFELFEYLKKLHLTDFAGSLSCTESSSESESESSVESESLASSVSIALHPVPDFQNLSEQIMKVLQTPNEYLISVLSLVSFLLFLIFL